MSEKSIKNSIKKFFNAVGQFFKYLFLTPSWGRKRRQAQQEYEETLDRAMKEVKNKHAESDMNNNTDIVVRFREFIENEGRSCSMDLAGITPEYVQRMWGGTVPIDEIEKAPAIVKAEDGR